MPSIDVCLSCLKPHMEAIAKLVYLGSELEFFLSLMERYPQVLDTKKNAVLSVRLYEAIVESIISQKEESPPLDGESDLKI